MSTFQVKAIRFHVTKRLLDPHTSLICFASGLRALKVRGQQPGILLARLPVHQKVDRISVLGRQPAVFQPYGLTRFVHQRIQSLVSRLTLWVQQITTFLSQNILLIPPGKQFLHLDFAKFGVSDQQDLGFCTVRANCVGIPDRPLWRLVWALDGNQDFEEYL